jgi:hypothetical protein
VVVVVPNGGTRRRQNAGEYTVRRGLRCRFARTARVQRLAVLGADSVSDQRHVGKCEHLREGKQPANGRTSPSSRFHGFCSQDKRGPMHTLVLTLGQNAVKARLLAVPLRVQAVENPGTCKGDVG